MGRLVDPPADRDRRRATERGTGRTSIETRSHLPRPADEQRHARRRLLSPPSSLGSTLPIAVTMATAGRFGLHPGSVLRLAAGSASVPVIVTAIVRPRMPASAFWTVDAAAAAPSLNLPAPGAPPYWSGAVFADPGEFAAMQTAFGLLPMELQWEFPLRLGGLQANQVPALEQSLNHAEGAAVPLSGDLVGAALPLTVHAELLTQLTAFTLTDTAAEQVLSLLFVSLTVVGAVVLLLAARINAARRAVELETVRSRGASLRQLTALTLAQQPAGLRSRGAGRRRPGAAPDAGTRGQPGLVAWRPDGAGGAARTARHRGMAVPETGTGPKPGPARPASYGPGGSRSHGLCRRHRRTGRAARSGGASAGKREPLCRGGSGAGRDPGRHRGGPALPADHPRPAPVVMPAAGALPGSWC